MAHEPHWTGIKFHAGRMQPFTCWHHGFTVKFVRTREEAEQAIADELRLRTRLGRT